MTDEKELIATAQIGEEAKRFLQTNVGRYLDESSKQDIEEAKNKLLELDPYAYKTIVDLQNAIMAIKQEAIYAMKLRGYLHEIIVRGNQATDLLHGDESENG